MKNIINWLAITVQFWKPLEVTPDSSEPFLLHRGDTLTISNPYFKWGKLAHVAAFVHGVKLYDKWQG